MNPTTMEHKIDIDHNDNDNDNDYNGDALSLRDLQMYDHTATSSTRSSPRTSSGQDLFEFFPTLLNHTATAIPDSIDKDNDHKLSDHHHRKVIGSSSLRLPERTALEHVIPLRSVSSRDQGSPRHGVKFSTSVKKENMTGSMSSKSKRRLFMFGLVKFMPEVEMSSIKERQGRRAPSRMFPVAADGGDGRKAVAGSHKRCRARLNSVFERSIACLGV